MGVRMGHLGRHADEGLAGDYSMWGFSFTEMGFSRVHLTPKRAGQKLMMTVGSRGRNE